MDVDQFLTILPFKFELPCIMSHFLEGPFLPLFFLGISSAYNVVEGCLQFSVDDLILGHHVHRFQVE